MDGVVIAVMGRGVRVKMNSEDKPVGDFNVISQQDSSILATVSVWKSVGSGLYNMIWSKGKAPTILPKEGDTVQSV